MLRHVPSLVLSAGSPSFPKGRGGVRQPPGGGRRGKIPGGLPAAPLGITQLSPSFKVDNRALKAARARPRWLIRFLISGPSWAMVAEYSGTQKTGS
jgi:hypothetical protein